ncbi:hypothetical protein L211DRAFT_813311 [Terfezia boudieri ATCC MYA-4762]|uniref:Uncharacterized protein n=1 Tax=Terfezia boudieri ATCC MYA-4762 TaxID=1051890 RepID=A0A3N4LFA5_9PEZI|nr:hypothetical protein L211DRAFT_813311 [Terfezia boudieri ATCC MYA-4762]
MSSGAKRKRGGEEDVGGPKEKKISKGNPSKPPLPSTQNKLEQQKPALHILRSESLRAFNRRVDASMPIPLKGPKTSKTDPIDHLPNSKSKSKQPNSTHAEDPEAEDYSDYLTDSSSTYSIDSYGDPRPKTFHYRVPRRPQKHAPGQKKKKNPRGPSPDPFAILLESRGKAKFGEMAEAPPELRVKPKEILRAPKGLGVDVGGIRKAVGSIAKREILAEERRGVVERYREMMEGKRAVGGA